MADLRLVQFPDVSACLEATQRYDDTFMAFSTSSLLEALSHQLNQKPQSSEQPSYLFAVYREDNLLLDADTLTDATALLSNSVFSQLSDPLAVDKVAGRHDAVVLFCQSYASLLLASGTAVAYNPDGAFNLLVAYATRATLPPLPTARSLYNVVPATADDLDGLAYLYIDFQASTPWHGVFTKEQALAVLEGPVAEGFNVYVAPAHRRKGMAEAMVHAVTRYYLGVPSPAQAPGTNGVPTGPPACGWKEEVNLNVDDRARATMRLYKRVGFLLPDYTEDVPTGGIDPITGARGWSISATLKVI
ncbi:hypothetical protein C8Q74DRAFT_1260817 [Fomes fomentarius]|nr:hypothetical protein C8Q74DRAFT_1260817 [Fomes fomentarius]